MKNSILKLSEKNVAIFGPFSRVVQALTTTFVELGSDVVVITPDLNYAQRFCNSLSDLRDVNSHYGRSLAFSADPKSVDEARDSISKVAESFGGVDIYIDANIPHIQSRLAHDTDLDPKELFVTSDYMTEGALQFLAGRGRGRLLYLCHYSLEEKVLLNNESIHSHIQKLAKEYQKRKVTVNAVSMGATDEFLLGQYPEETSLTDALQKHQEFAPQSEIVDSYDVANMINFLASPLSSAITGQVIRITAGMDL